MKNGNKMNTKSFLSSSISLIILLISGYSNVFAQKIDKSKQARILITTDLEADDMNGVILSLMYADQYDLAGIVWTAGMYHFNGDGGLHTLG